MNPLTYRQRIEHNIQAKLAPVYLEIIDDSARHKGHAGYNPRGETHFKIKVVSTIFSGLSRLERHRLIHEALVDELHERVHAINIQALTPDEFQP